MNSTENNGLNLGVPEGVAFPDPLITSVGLLLNDTNIVCQIW